MTLDPENLDSALADALEGYLCALQAGDEVRCRELLQHHPELARYSASLQALDRMSPDVQFASSVLSALAAGTPATVNPCDRQPSTANIEIDGTPATGASQPVQPIREFGRYELLEELGRGGMGVVFRARQTDLDRIVAVKMILVNRLASDEEIRRFYQEAKAAGRLCHPHIVPIHEVGEIHGQHFFSMDCIDGPSLAGLLALGVVPVPERQGAQSDSPMRFPANADAAPENASRVNWQPLNMDYAARILRDISRAVDFLHCQGIIHRDLKPSNILLSRSGQPYLTDFGLAKCASTNGQETHSGTIVGTPLYMSPEQAAGRASAIGPASDIYSLGAILYQVLTGRVPHQASNPMQTLVSVMESEPELPRLLNPDVPRELEAICLKCLEKDPQNRYAKAAELADELDRYLRGEPVRAQTTGMVHHIRRWMRREPALASRWAALLLGAIVLWGAFQRGDVGESTHSQIQWLLAGWALSAFVLQRLVKLDVVATVARYAWLATDAIFLTRVLMLAGHPVGPLLIAYPMLIAASGLFFQEGLVLFMTFVSLVSYAALVWLEPEEANPAHYCLIFAGVIIVIGWVTSHQVHRIRNLSRHFDG